MSNPASVDDVENRFWRPLTAQETTNVEFWLDDAWAMLLGRRPNIEADLTAETVSEANVVRVLAAMVIRILDNPRGLEEFALDDFRGRRNALAASGALSITSDELADVTPGRRSRRSVRLVSYGDE